MMKGKSGEKSLLLGTDTNTGTANGSRGGYIYYGRVKADKSGSCVEIHVYAGVDSTVRMAIYSDKAGPLPDLLLGESASTPVINSQWNVVPLLAPVAIVKDSYYWIGAQCDLASGGFRTFANAGDQYGESNYGPFASPPTIWGTLNLGVTAGGWG